MGKQLTTTQQKFYEENGYLNQLPIVFAKQFMDQGYNQLTALLDEDETSSDMINWHQTSRWLYDVATHPLLLDCVEDILGPNFVLQAAEFITKAPKSDKTIPWHQDTYYWGRDGGVSVTAWIAFTDVDEGNAAMKVIPGTHKSGLIKHKIASDESLIFFELDGGSFSTKDAISLNIPAGSFSLHDDRIIHGSLANMSDRWRIACVCRFTSTNVKFDFTQNPNLRLYLARGVDEFGHNPISQPPIELFARPSFNTKRIRKRS